MIKNLPGPRYSIVLSRPLLVKNIFWGVLSLEISVNVPLVKISPVIAPVSNPVKPASELGVPIGGESEDKGFSINKDLI